MTSPRLLFCVLSTVEDASGQLQFWKSETNPIECRSPKVQWRMANGERTADYADLTDEERIVSPMSYPRYPRNPWLKSLRASDFGFRVFRSLRRPAVVDFNQADASAVVESREQSGVIARR